MKIVYPYPEDIKDLRAWVAAGCDRSELDAAIRGAKLYEPPPEEDEEPETTERFTDLGNTQRLVRLHGANLRYCHALGGWLHWDGRRWASDPGGLVVMRFTKLAVVAIYKEAAESGRHSARHAIVDHAKESESAARLKAMIELAKSEPGVAVSPEQLDADHYLLNALNRTIDLRTGELRPHHRGDLITKLAPVEYDPDAAMPMWDDMLTQATNADAELLGFLQRVAGYSLTSDTGEEALFFVRGPGASGKSTFVEALKSAMGDYAATRTSRRSSRGRRRAGRATTWRGSRGRGSSPRSRSTRASGWRKGW